MMEMSDLERLPRDYLATILELTLEMSRAPTVDEICRMAVTSCTAATGVDRMGIWFVDPASPDTFIGSFGIDEAGALRDERESRITIDRSIYNAKFFDRHIPYRLYRDSPVYNDRSSVVGTADLVIAPIWNGTDTIGAVSADNKLSGAPLSDESCQLVALLARTVGHLVTIKRTEIILERLATTDDLTGVFNRRTGMEFLGHHMRLARRNGAPISIAFIDLNDFKRINDEHGHHAGDEYLKEVVTVILTVLRETDLVCRMGGDEFMIILPDSSRDDARSIESRLAAETERSPLLRRYRQGNWMSVGVAGFDEITENHTVEQLVAAADEEMYRAKRANREKQDG
jgi:diguanylate cyclase (GGDEF)-like protein